MISIYQNNLKIYLKKIKTQFNYTSKHTLNICDNQDENFKKFIKLFIFIFVYIYSNHNIKLLFQFLTMLINKIVF